MTMLTLVFPARVQLYTCRHDNTLCRTRNFIEQEERHEVSKPEVKLLTDASPTLAAPVKWRGQPHYFLVEELSEDIKRQCAEWEAYMASIRSNPRLISQRLMRERQEGWTRERIFTMMRVFMRADLRVLDKTSNTLQRIFP